MDNDPFNYMKYFPQGIPNYDNGSFRKCSDESTKFRKEGNELYLKNHDFEDLHSQVLSLYSKSIAYAPNNSEELALGYGNRSALLVHVQKFKECISDVEKALLITKSDKLKAKLLTRRALCIQFIDSLKKNSKPASKTKEPSSEKLQLPKIVPSTKISYLSNSVTLEYNETYGKHIVANRDIKPGEIIAEEEAYVFFPLKKKLYLVCSHCLSQTWNGIPCDNCAAIVYCSEDCKNQAWQEYHDIECSTFTNDKFQKIVPTDEINQSNYKGAMRFFIKIIKNHSAESIIKEFKKSDSFDGTFLHNQFKSFYNLTSQNTKSMVAYTFAKEGLKILSKFIQQHFDTIGEQSHFKNENEAMELADHLLTKFVYIISKNSFMFEGYTCNCAACNDDSNITYDNRSINCKVKGMILVPSCSLFNHSCVPNIDRIFVEKKKIIFVSTRPIRSGEQVFINYYQGAVSLYCPKSKRQNLLYGSFKFICNCPACAEDWLPPSKSNVKPNDPRIIKVWAENSKFCRRKGMEPYPLDDLDSSSKKTIQQLTNIIELLYAALNDYEAEIVSMSFKYKLVRAFWKLYGTEWMKPNDCLK